MAKVLKNNEHDDVFQGSTIVNRKKDLESSRKARMKLASDLALGKVERAFAYDKYGREMVVYKRVKQ